MDVFAGISPVELEAAAKGRCVAVLAGHDGTAKVGLFNPDMTPIAGFEPENCLPIPNDVVRGEVKWQERSSIQQLKGKEVHVLIQMRSGNFYAIRL